jgi:hypothetical protein
VGYSTTAKPFEFLRALITFMGEQRYRYGVKHNDMIRHIALSNTSDIILGCASLRLRVLQGLRLAELAPGSWVTDDHLKLATLFN